MDLPQITGTFSYDAAKTTDITFECKKMEIIENSTNIILVFVEILLINMLHGGEIC
jgi:hypothetical protein